ncbi:MAG TPA: YchJ family protein [Opitutaceae bacterium]|jgi:SEC-C motif-containing protein|nr:YchJ family protein [Opitutaceae bacterium]
MARPPTDSKLPLEAQPCPCGSGKTYGDCCGPVHKGTRIPATPEELMRARFSAHALDDYAFLHRTYRPTAKEPFVPSDDNPTTQWTRLEIHGTGPGKAPGFEFVEFSAYGLEQGVEHVLHEKAEFMREDGAWTYTKPLREGPAPVVSSKKVGRNDPCPCGSGKKYKHCCLLKA